MGKMGETVDNILISTLDRIERTSFGRVVLTFCMVSILIPIFVLIVIFMHFGIWIQEELLSLRRNSFRIDWQRDELAYGMFKTFLFLFALPFICLLGNIDTLSDYRKDFEHV